MCNDEACHIYLAIKWHIENGDETEMEDIWEARFSIYTIFDRYGSNFNAVPHEYEFV